MNKQQDYRKWVEVTKKKESRPILYSLKLALRMINGQFTDTKIFQVNSSSLSFDQKFKEKITLDCWYKPNQRGAGGEDSDEIAQISSNSGLVIMPGKPKAFSAGAIIENPDDIVEGQLYWFYLFKVAVGRSYCYRRKEEEKKYDDFSKIPLPPNYDSVYLEGESPSKNYKLMTVNR
jgi:hypothetical protein